VTPRLPLGSHLCNPSCFGREPKVRVATLTVKDFDVFGHFNHVLLELEEIPPLPHFESVFSILHPNLSSFVTF
jgi:hypothetical protein